MKQKNICIFVLTLCIFSISLINATTVGGDIPLNVSFPLPPEEGVFDVFVCDRHIIDDNVEPWKVSEGGEELIERVNNYAFEGEKIQWTVLVVDLYGKEEIKKVYTTVGDNQGVGNEYYSSCQKIMRNLSQINFESCNAHIRSYRIKEFDSETMEYYNCTITIKSSEEIYGEKWITVEAKTHSNLLTAMDENEYWFFNPTIALSIEGDTISFENLTQSQISYSNPLNVINKADESSGVMLDMFISGTDFKDTTSQFAYCPDKRTLPLSRIKYFATNGAYNTNETVNSDSDGYRPINYATEFNATKFYGNYEIVPKIQVTNKPIYPSNIIAPDGYMTLNFKIDVPESCVGTFDSGNIYFWAQAI